MTETEIMKTEYDRMMKFVNGSQEPNLTLPTHPDQKLSQLTEVQIVERGVYVCPCAISSINSWLKNSKHTHITALSHSDCCCGKIKMLGN